MDYEKKYNKMLEKGRKYHQKFIDDGNFEAATFFEEVFPELKFREGDWVIYDHKAYQIVELPKEGFINLGLKRNEKIEYAPSTYCTPWTIQDAKDGDVLVYGDNPANHHLRIIMLFKSMRTFNSARNHFHIFDDEFRINDWCDCGKTAHPATKEQRDLLFQKMKEAGYKWDAEKKELKKIEGVQKWGEEDECYMCECISAIATKDGWTFEEKRKTKHWLKSLKQRMEEQQ